jgi:hypothetical protein
MNKQMTRSKAAVISTNEDSMHQSKRNKDRNAETEGSSEIRTISEEVITYLNEELTENFQLE